MADPYRIYTSGNRIHPRFEVDEKNGEDRSRTNHLHSDRNIGLDDFVDDSNLSEVIPIDIDYSDDRRCRNDEKGTSRVSSPSQKKGIEDFRSKHPDNDGKYCSNGDQNSPIEETYLHGFDDVSFGDSEPSISTSQSEKELVSETATVTTAISPINDDLFLRSGEPDRPLSDLKQRIQLLEGGVSSDGFSGYARYSNEDEKRFGKARRNGPGGDEMTGSGHEDWMIHQKRKGVCQDFLDYDYPGIASVLCTGPWQGFIQ